MKAILKKVIPTPENSLNVHKDVGPEMPSAWHYHPEQELLLIKKSAGTCLIGDFVSSFKAGDVYIFGVNLPHTFAMKTNTCIARKTKWGNPLWCCFFRSCYRSISVTCRNLKPC
ncbi:hypothetical protein GA0116948_11544 [Chitinophaga costaii]|uniref:Cupin domain-containing protein n=1 Tax=Chitinophaga costaii TaxID=1335309 RepID=A0A1C4FM26_9BACT|nr:cupin domain-containing protein [Chitinophaga costaii]PUZ29975.1 cupin domain-containing protein [Chitinophaga costaii]SCC56665.1 hypothetical protein GA0116948_11544 [Chitinophaga costaii]